MVQAERHTKLVLCVLANAVVHSTGSLPSPRGTVHFPSDVVRHCTAVALQTHWFRWQRKTIITWRVFIADSTFIRSKALSVDDVYPFLSLLFA